MLYSSPRKKKMKSLLKKISKNWDPRWDKGNDIDFFYQYLLDQNAAANVWGVIEEDIFIIIDKNKSVLFANIANLCQLLFGQETQELLVRCFDMWSHYIPMPLPGSQRHVVDKHIRSIFPHLDTEIVTVDTLPNAKMAVAHYGCWASTGNPHGRRVVRTSDSRFLNIPRIYQPAAREVFDGFCKSALGKVTEMIRFLEQHLDHYCYADSEQIYQNLPEDERLVPTNNDFMSLFVVGINVHTERHRDAADTKGGLAGLVTVGYCREGRWGQSDAT
jgi:hypothetical protein